MKTYARLTSSAVTLGAILALSATLSGCKKAATTDDTSLATAVHTKIFSDSAISAEPIQSSVQNGVVTLNGTVSSEAARSLAASDAGQVAGVRTVVNNLTVGTAMAATPAPAPAPIPAPAPVAMTAKPAPRPSPQVVTRPAAPAPAYVPAPPPAPAPVVVQAPPPPPPPPPPPAFRNVTLQAGTSLSVRITQTLDSATTKTGDPFSGSLASDVIADGLIVIPHGTGVSGRVDDAKDATHYTGSSLLSISLISIDRRGDRIPVTTEAYAKQGAARGKNTAEKVGGGAAVGAILGGILGGGKGAAIGAAAGGGVGAGANTVTKGQQVQIPSESLLRFTLASPIIVRVSLNSSSSNSDGGLQRR